MFKEFACARVNTNIFLVFVIVGRKCVMPFFTLYLKYLRLTSQEVGVIRGSQSWIAMILIPIWVCFVKRSRESLKTRVLLLISVFLTASMYSCLVFVPPIGGAYDVTHCDSLRSGHHELVIIHSDSLEHGSNKLKDKESPNASNLASSTSNGSIVSKPLSEHNSSIAIANREYSPVRFNISSKQNTENVKVQPTLSSLEQSKNNALPTVFSNQEQTSVENFSGFLAPTEAEPSVLGKIEEYSPEESSWKYGPYYKVFGQLFTGLGRDEPVPHLSSFPYEEISAKYPTMKAFKNRQQMSPPLKNDLQKGWSFGKMEGRAEKAETVEEDKSDIFRGKKPSQDTDMYPSEDDWYRLSSLVKNTMDSGGGDTMENGLSVVQKPYHENSRSQEEWGKEMNRLEDENLLNEQRGWEKPGRRKLPGKKKIHLKKFEENDDESEDDETQIPTRPPRYEWLTKREMKRSQPNHHFKYGSRVGRSLLANGHLDVVARPVGQGGVAAEAEDSGPLAFRTVLLLSSLAELFACMPVPAVTTLWWLHLDDAEHTEQFGEHRLHSLLASVPAVMALVVAISRSPCILVVGPHQITLHLLAAATVFLSTIPLILALPLVPASKAWRRSSETSSSTILSHRGYISGHQILAVSTAVLGGVISAAAGEYVLWHVDTISGFSHNYELIFGGCVAVGALVEAAFTALFGGRCISGLSNITGPLGLILMSMYLGAVAVSQQVWVFVALSGLLGGAQALLFRALYGAHPGPGDTVSGQTMGWRFGYGLGCFVSGFIGEVFGMRILFWSAAGAAAIWAILSACCYKLILPPLSTSLLRGTLGQKGSRSRRRRKRLYSRLLFPPEDGEMLLKGGAKGLISGEEDGVEVEMDEESEDWLERALREDVSGLRTTPANL